MTAHVIWPADKVERRSINTLTPYARNARTHSKEQIDQIAASIKEWGWTMPVLVDEDGVLIAGHGRILAAHKLGIDEIPTMVATGWDEAKRRAYVLVDNQLTLNGGWDMDLLASELAGLQADGFDLDLLGFDDKALADLLAEPLPGDDSAAIGKGKLKERFLIPPFTVLSAREGWWQERKRAWLALGIRSEEGRGDNNSAAPGGSAMPATDYRKSGQRGDGSGKSKFGKCLETGIGEAYGREEMNATSIFDPVLCEIAYRWFCPEGGLVLDPFAGGSVRGVVASKLGRQYVWHELRGEQVVANRVQGEALCADDAMPPRWIEGDSRTIDTTCADVHADMVFSCPPYADLEVYSDDPADLSTLAYPAFRDAYFEIIRKACERLKQDRFACFVVGEVRDKAGNYYDFVGDTVQAFRDAGLHYYNEAILVTAVGSLPIRAGKQFAASRKLGKTHQNVLVFVKGDGKKAAKACGHVEVATDPEAPADAQ